MKGKVEEKVVWLTNDRNLEADGTGEKVAGKGKIQKKVGELKKAVARP